MDQPDLPSKYAFRTYLSGNDRTAVVSGISEGFEKNEVIGQLPVCQVFSLVRNVKRDPITLDIL
jgi:hypothetical protein